MAEVSWTCPDCGEKDTRVLKGRVRKGGRIIAKLQMEHGHREKKREEEYRKRDEAIRKGHFLSYLVDWAAEEYQ